MSEVKVNKITPTANCGTVTLGDSGDTIAIPAGVTLTSGGALQNSGTITNTGTISGVAITGTIDNQVNWQTTVKTANFTATAGEGYFCNTTSGAFTVTLPASPSAGDLVGIKDYANTADTNNITIGRNGSNIEGVANDFVISIEGGSITLIYVDATKGWLSTAAAKASDITEQQLFVAATGGTITTSGDFKIHTFTGPGTFTVTCAGTAPGSTTVDYLVVGGGGAGGGAQGGGGGAGGFRESSGAASGCYSRSPLGACVSALPVSAQAYPITVGAGGVGVTGGGAANSGSNSVFSTITSTAGGGAGGEGSDGSPGGSGGGGGMPPARSAGTGNTPPVSPPQGSNGGEGNFTPSTRAAGGGGGAGGVGQDGQPSYNGGNGGAGVSTSITGSPVTRGGGGGGSGGNGPPGTLGSGGTGSGGGAPGTSWLGPSPQGNASAPSGTVNTGGGGGGVTNYANQSPVLGGNGGSGIIVIRYKFQ
jgi:hypothetical protein